MNIPLLDLKAQYETLRDEIELSLKKVLESQHFIMGAFVKQFEKEVAEYCESDFAFGCASGSDALLLALMAIDLKPGDYVILPPFTFFATAGAVHRLGAIPVFIDIDPLSFNLDPKKIEEFLQGKGKVYDRIKPDLKRVKAIIPVHLYGQMAEMGPIMDIAKRFDLYVIEDAAQSIGSRYKGSQAGNIGDIGCFSFFPSKNLGAYGDAGLVTTNDEVLAQKLDILRLHGARPKYHHKFVGINSRLDAIQAAILSVKLKYLDQWSETRRDKALKYNMLFNKSELVQSSDLICANDCDSLGTDCKLNSDKLILPLETTGNPENGGRHIYHQYTIRVKNRDRVVDMLKQEGIGSAIYYPVSLHIQECFSELGYQKEDCPISYCASQQSLSLPIYPELNDDQQEKVVNTIAKALH
ncbi:MAG: DegT/DnrJ/EryC1/StrS family aminotransferase [Balneola sp.]|nr:MAG: DegT/DnrJ/EryC1/StrS family aminotransferase [Balneola sp.]